VKLLAAAGAAAILGGAAPAPTSPVIVFAADRTPAVSGDVYRADANGHVVNLTHSPWQDTQPLVSPDGKLVAFLSDRGGAGLWVMGIDGRGLRRLVTKGLSSQQYVEMAWAPNGKELALVEGDVNHALLSIAGVGTRPRAIAQAGAFGTPAWSPDGKLVTVAALGETAAYTAAGRRAWSVTSGRTGSWSARGLFAAGVYDGRAHVYDEHGRPVFTVAAESTVWSPNGAELASVNGRRVEVHTSTGRLVLQATLTVPNADVLWVSADALAFTDENGAGHRLDLATGRTTPFDIGSFGLNTSGAGLHWAVRDGAHVYAHVTGCNDDSGPGAAIASLQRVPHSTSIVYQSYCAEPFDNLYSMSADGTGLRRITNDQAEETSPQLSPDRTEIAYAWADATGLSCKGCATSVRTVHVDGAAGLTLTNPPDCTFDASPSWSPDGTQIAFSHSGCDTAPDLMVVPATGGAPKDLHLPGWQVAWGPASIAYVDGATDPSSVWTALPDGTGKWKVGSGNVSSPAWSSDGRLAYLVGTAVAVDGKRIALPFRQVRSLAWAPDGTRFVVAARGATDATFDVYVVKTDGTGAVKLTQNFDVSSVFER